MSKLEIDFFEDAPDSWAHLKFRQEGMRGFRLPLSYLPEFIDALENLDNPQPFLFFIQLLRASHKILVYTVRFYNTDASIAY